MKGFKIGISPLILNLQNKTKKLTKFKKIKEKRSFQKVERFWAKNDFLDLVKTFYRYIILHHLGAMAMYNVHLYPKVETFPLELLVSFMCMWISNADRYLCNISNIYGRKQMID